MKERPVSEAQVPVPELDPGCFVLCEEGKRAAPPRSLASPDGLGDRLRTAAFAEWQAITAFRWAADFFHDAPNSLRSDWSAQVADEELHYQLIIQRMDELGIDPAGRPVSAGLWHSLKSCETAKDFCLSIVMAEERGRQAALKLIQYLGHSDPDTAAVFQKIVEDEVSHVALAETYYGWTPES